MSEHADITKHCLATAIKHNFNYAETLDNLNGTLEAAEYGEEFLCPSYQLANWVKQILLSQKDGLYGVSHSAINDWLSRRCDE